MKKRIICILLAVMLCLVSGCNTGDRVLHKAKWDMTKAELTAAEGEKNIIKGESEQVLNWMQTKELTVFGDRTVSVGYVFSADDRLTNITVQIFLNEGESLVEGMKATRAAMDKVYGASEGEDATAHWHLKRGTVSLSTIKGADTFFLANFSSAEHHH